jgi:Protein of unknown function (DUF3102)
VRVASNYLVDIAHRIRNEHSAACAGIKVTVAHALAAGDLLIEAKAQLKHGQWLPWLKEHCEISERTAQNYMRLAKNRDAIAKSAEDCAFASIDGAIKSLIQNAAPVPVSAEPPRPPRLPEPGEHAIPIERVVFNKDLYPRLCHKPDLVDRYLEFLPDLPPIEINQHCVLIDGWHRLEAHKDAGAETINVVVTDVADENEHFCLAIKRNATHGEQLPIDVERMAQGSKRAVQRQEHPETLR